MIVCHCNVLSDRQILDAVGAASGVAPASPMEAYRCLGCSPKCGRCFATVRALLNDASAAACAVGCVSCPAHEHHHAEPANDADAPIFLIAAE